MTFWVEAAICLDSCDCQTGCWHLRSSYYAFLPPRPNQIRWNRGNESLPERAEAVGETLTLPGLVSADNGTYTCEASNKHGHARALYVLVVYDPGAVVEAQTSVPYAIVGGILALLVFLIICVLVGMVWCSVRQKGE